MSAAEKHSWFWLALSWAVSFPAVGWPYWQTTYAEVSLPGTLYDWGLGLVLVLAALNLGLGKLRFWLVVLGLGSAVPAAVLARVLVDTAKDPTSHNLWPIEVVLAAGVGWVAAAVGALAGKLVGFYARRQNRQ